MKRFTLLFILFLTLVGLAFPKTAHAQTAGVAGTAQLINLIESKEDVAKILERCEKDGTSAKECFIPNSSYLMMDSVSLGVMGAPQTAFDPKSSLLAAMSGVIAGTYANPPASMAYWIKDVGQDLGFMPKEANAQGIGFSGFSALLPLWKVFRNIAYFLLAVIMIVIGFMVMFRKKIDPKTVVTVQNALPRIVLTLLLITFSYAIVGLLIDFMYLVMYLVVSVFTSTGLLPDPGSVSSWLAGTNTTQAFYTQGNLFANIVQATSTLNIFRIFGLNITTWQAQLGGMSVSGALLGIIGVIAATGATAGAAVPALGISALATTLAVPILQLILAIAMLFLFIRLLIFFIGAYIQIVVAMLFGPIQILFEAVPGTNSFASWIQNLIANLAVFPIGVIFFMLSAIFAKFATQSGSGVWSPGLSSLTANTTGISALISLGILFAIPSIGGAIKEALKAKPFVSAGPEAIAGTFSQPLGLAMQGFQIWRSEESIKAMRNLKPIAPATGDTESKK